MHSATEAFLKIPDRSEAFELLSEYTQNENLIRHALSVEAAMRHYAALSNEDEELWGVVGLLHDFDYERFPSQNEHPYEGVKILRERGYDETLIQAILSHAPYTNVSRETLLEKTLFAVDELCGLVTAVALVRPSKRLADVEVKSVKKKMKDKAFARGVDRDHIREGTEALGIDLATHIGHVITAMRLVSSDLGL